MMHWTCKRRNFQLRLLSCGAFGEVNEVCMTLKVVESYYSTSIQVMNT